MDQRAIAAIGGGLSRALQRLQGLHSASRQQEYEAALAEQDQKRRSHEWTMNYLERLGSQKREEQRHQEQLQEIRDAETRQAERESRNNAIKEEERARFLDADEDTRFDAFLRGRYVPASDLEENRFKARYEGDMAEYAAKGQKKTGAGKERPTPDYIGQTLELTGDIADTRRQIASTNSNLGPDQAIPDPFLDIQSPVQAYNLAIRPKVMADTATFRDPARAADSIEARLGGQPWPPKPSQFSQQPNGSWGVTRPTAQFVAPGGAAPATPDLNGYAPEELSELQQLLLQYHSTPDHRGKAMKPEELKRLYQLVYKGEM